MLYRHSEEQNTWKNPLFYVKSPFQRQHRCLTEEAGVLVGSNRKETWKFANAITLGKVID